MSSVQDLDLRQFIRDVPDFPQPGVLFRDITPLLSDSVAFRVVTDRLAEAVEGVGVDSIVGVESRGFIFGAPLAQRLNLPFVPVRKAGKLPAPLMSVEYALEYGTSQLDIHEDAFADGQRVAIVDDVLATGGTAEATARLVEMVGGNVAVLLFLAELSFLSGRERLGNYRVQSLITY